MNFLTTMQTPLYSIGANGFFNRVSSVPAGTELTVTKTAIDPLSERVIGYLASGEIIYTDGLTQVLDEVEVKSTRLWGWLVGIGLAGFVGYKIYKYKTK